MDRNVLERLNSEIERYKVSLRYFARTCDWGSFRSKAAQLFDYLESTEVSLVKTRFYGTIGIIVMTLVAVVMLFTALGNVIAPFVARYRDGLLVVVLGAYGLGLLLLLELRLYLSIRTSRHGKRVDRFIRAIEGDVRSYMGPDACRPQG